MENPETVSIVNLHIHTHTDRQTVFIDTADEQDVVENPETVSIVNLHIHTHRQTNTQTDRQYL